MRTVFIILSVCVVFTCIQYSNGAPRRVRPLDSDEIPNSMTKFAYKLKPYMNTDSTEELHESSEEEKKKVIDTNEYIEKSEELSNEQNEEDDDSEAMFPHFIIDDREKQFEN